MKVAVTAAEPSLDAMADPRFGRCPYFLVIETDDMSARALENPNVSLGGGAGIQSAQLMAEQGVQTVLTGNCGPNAHQTLSAAGIGVIVGCTGTVADVVKQFMAGQLHAAGRPNVAGKFGIGGASGAVRSGSVPAPPPLGGPGVGMGAGGAAGMGMGQGGGRGIGRGMGRGRGMGMGAGPGPAPVPRPAQPAPSLPVDQELALLKQQAEAVSRQMQEIQERIRQIEAQQQSSMTATVEPDKCTGCGLCVEACPVDAIDLQDGIAVVDAQRCTGCGACAGECPNQAIAVA